MKIPKEQGKQPTENRILDAARQVFLDKGLEGARMQEIADKAGINKALLHYYFRNKEKLFECVFESVIESFIPQIIDLLDSNKPIFDKIEQFVSLYIDVLNANPFIPRFVIHELNRDPERLTAMMERVAGKEIRRNLKKLGKNMEDASQNGSIRPVEATHFVINMLSLCIFPVIATPIVSGIIFRNNDKEYKQFLLKRKEVVSEFIINALKI